MKNEIRIALNIVRAAMETNDAEKENLLLLLASTFLMYSCGVPANRLAICINEETANLLIQLIERLPRKAEG